MPTPEQRGGQPGGIARNILSNWVNFVLTAAVSFFVSPIVVRSLGETQYGVWVLLASIVGNLGLLDLGVRIAVTRYVAVFHASAEHDRAHRLYSSAIWIFSAAGGLAILLSGLIVLLIGRVFNVPAELQLIARVVTVLGGINIAITLLSGVFGGVIVALERFDYNNGADIGVTLLRTIGVLAALKTGQGLIGLALVQLAATLLRAAINVYLVRRLYPDLDLTPRTWDRESSRLIFNYGLSASLLFSSTAVMMYSDSLVIGALLPVAMVTYFAIAGSLFDYSRSIVLGISQTLVPRTSRLQATGQHGVLGSTLLTHARLTSLVIAPIAVTFMVRGPSFIELWIGPSYAELAGRVLFVLCFPLLTIAGYQVVMSSILGINKHRVLIPVFCAEAGVNIALSVVLVRMYGVIGTALGTAVPRVIVSALICPWCAQKTLAVPLRTFWRSVFIMPWLAIVPFGVGSYLVERTWPAQHMATFFGQVAMLMPLAAFPAWIMCLSREERAIVTSAASGGLRRVLRRTSTSSAG